MRSSPAASGANAATIDMMDATSCFCSLAIRGLPSFKPGGETLAEPEYTFNLRHTILP